MMIIDVRLFPHLQPPFPLPPPSPASSGVSPLWLISRDIYCPHAVYTHTHKKKIAVARTRKEKQQEELRKKQYSEGKQRN